ncbi:unnamed protein product [Calypogeia fissa]
MDFQHNKKASNAIQQIVQIFAISVTIVVVAVPEGLPLAVTLTLAYSMRKMMNDKALVRNLAACETMGSATTICSDKTGTLTLNKMSVAKSWIAGHLLEAAENVKAMVPDEIYRLLLVGICQNSSGSVFTPKVGEVEISGSPTESAALAWGVNIGMNFDEIKSDTSVIHVETFNSEKKRAGVVVKHADGSYKAHWKGAAEMILELSGKWVNADGKVQEMTPENVKEFGNHIEGMAAASLRCIAFAYKELEPEHIPLDHDKKGLQAWKIPDQGLVFVAVVGIKDPCRPGVAEAVGRCQAAGVKVRMVTGDSVITAKAIAAECGILSPHGTVVEGKDFRLYNEEQLDRILPNLDVMARSSPSDKLLLVKALKARGEVVAVTGDGTNDAPALHDADVGLSMGIAGTEVAKESSDIVILDDNFASIVKVVRWGRSVYANIQKFIQFQLTVNVTALVLNFVCAVSSGTVPLTAVQLLWVNLIMDTLGALALATEEPTDDLMERTPVGRTEPLITNVMWRNLFGQALYQIAVLMTINYGGKKIFKLENHPDATLIKNTIVFNSFVLCQIFNEVNSRRLEKKNIFEGLQRNYLFMGIILMEAVFQFLIVQFLKKFATTHALTWEQWLICVAIGLVSWPLALLLKFIPVREKPYFNTKRIRLKWRRSAARGIQRDIDGSNSEERELAPYSTSNV